MLMIDLVFYNNTSNRKWGKSFFEGVLNKTAQYKELNLNKKIKYGLSIHLIGEAKIKSLNKKYRGKNSITDVLSFPLNNSLIGKELKIYGTIDLGDIFISLPVAKKEARVLKKSLENQLRFLTIHGLLHLLGFNHEESKEKKKKMFDLQSGILKSLATSH